MRNRIVYNPHERKKYKQSPTISRKAVSIFIIGGALAGGFLYAVWHPRLQIAKIQISGNHAVAEDAVRRRVTQALEETYVFVFPRRFILFPQSKWITDGLLREFPVVERVQVIKHYPDSLEINLSERKFFGIVCNDLEEDESTKENNSASTTVLISEISRENGEMEEKIIQCVYIDRNGFAYEDAPNSSGALIARIAVDQETIPIPSALIDPSLMVNMGYLMEKLPIVAGVNVARFELFSRMASEFRVKTSGGYKLFFMRADDLENALGILKTVLEDAKERKNQLEYVDLRFGNKVFFKMK